MSTILLLFASAFAPAQDIQEDFIHKEIVIKAGQLQLGKELSEIRRTQSARDLGFGLPRTIGWGQEFELGRVYWTAQARARVIHGDILTRWVQEGEVQGLGFPLSDEQPCNVQGQGNRFQTFEGGAIFWRASNRETTVHPLRTAADYFSLPRCAEPPVEDQAGRFRVILTGFSVNRQTNDNILESDGKGDEVFIVAEVAQYGHAGVRARSSPRLPPLLSGRPPLTLRRTITSVLMGDANNQEMPRIRAGTAGENGGLRTGDRFPTNEPWRLVGTPSANRLPMVVWEGELSQGIVIIVPTIWEWDDGNLRAREQFVRDINIHFTFGTYQDDGLVAGGVAASDIFGAGDRPIGGLGDPSSIRLDFPTAAAAVQRSVNHGPGEFEIHYSGETEDYTLYYKVERLR